MICLSPKLDEHFGLFTIVLNQSRNMIINEKIVNHALRENTQTSPMGSSKNCKSNCCRNKVRGWVLYLYYKDRFHWLIHKYYCKYVSIHTYLSHYILSVLFGSLLSAIVHLLPQINVHRDMRTALFCVVCARPVFIMFHNPDWDIDNIFGGSSHGWTPRWPHFNVQFLGYARRQRQTDRQTRLQ